MTKIDDIRSKYHASAKPSVTLEELARFKLSHLTNPEIYQRILETVIDPQFTTEISLAINFLAELKKVLKPYPEFPEESPQLYKKYQEILTYLQFNSLPVLPLEEIENLFKNYLLFAFDWGISPLERTLFSFSFHGFTPEPCFQIRDAVLRGLKANQELLGSKSIIFENKEVRPYISNWLKEYDHFFEEVKEKRLLDEVTYINQSSNVRKLSAEQKELLRQLLLLYDSLRFLPLTFELLITPVRRVPTAITPPVKPVRKEVPPIEARGADLKFRINQSYQGDPLKNQQIQKEEEKLKKSIGDRAEKLREEFYLAVQNKNVFSTIAVLRLMVQFGQLDKFLIQDERLKSFLAKVWEKKYGKEVSEEFKKDPATLRFLKLFLKYILQERLGVAENEAARIGAQISNLFLKKGKREYQKLAYFDRKSKEFRWF